MPKQSQSFFVYRIQSKENYCYRKRIFQGKGRVKDWTKTKRKLLNIYGIHIFSSLKISNKKHT